MLCYSALSLIDVWQIASEQIVLCFIFSLNHFYLKFRIIFCVKSQIFEASPLGGGKGVEKQMLTLCWATDHKSPRYPTFFSGFCQQWWKLMRYVKLGRGK